MAKDKRVFPDPNLNLGVEASFRVGVVVLVVEGIALTGGAMVILLPKVNVGKQGEVFGLSGEVEEDGIIDGVGGSVDVVEDVAKGNVNPELVSEANEFVLREGLSMEIDDKTGLLCVFCGSDPNELLVMFGRLLWSPKSQDWPFPLGRLSMVALSEVVLCESNFWKLDDGPTSETVELEATPFPAPIMLLLI